MLGKLLKYDWTLSWKVSAVICGFLVLLTMISIPILNHSMWNLHYEWLANLSVLITLLYLFMIWACPVGVFFYHCIRYYKNLYSDEGYLTATLPVYPWQIVASKLITTMVWSLISGLVMVSGILLLMITIGELSVSPSELSNMLYQVIYELLEMNYFTFFLSLLLLTLSSSIFSILLVFTSIALGQMFTSHRIAGAVIWYMILNTVVQFLGFFFFMIPVFSIGGLLEPGVADGIKLFFSILFLVVTAADALMFFICEYMLRKNLNLE